MDQQTNIFEYISPAFKITKPVRLIEMFAGIGSQAKALKNLGVDFEHWKVIEFDRHAMDSYNAIHGTAFETSDIRNIHASDLDLRERERVQYILTYSFPCQDLSNAGLRRGMKKGTGTRSGLLWEVERILGECGTELPHVLLMENVPQVIGKKNINDFFLWRKRLEEFGYSNYVQVLNAKDYGIPQNRERCFMVSILGDWNYTFPKKFPLTVFLKDVLETNVDEKYYLSGKKIEALQRQLKKDHKPNLLSTDTHTHTQSQRHIGRADCGNNTSQIVIVANTRPEKKIHQRDRVIHPRGVSPTLTATDYKDPLKVMVEVNGITVAHRQDFQRGELSGISRTLLAERHDASVCIWQYAIPIPEKTKKGYALAQAGDGVYLDRPHQKRGVVQKQTIPTLKTSGSDIGVVVEEDEKE